MQKKNAAGIQKASATWLGLNWDFGRGEVHITNTRIYDVKRSIDGLLRHTLVPNTAVQVRILAKALGQIVSMHTVLGPLVQLKTKEAFRCVNSRASWNACVLLTPQTKSELEFWKCNVDRLNVLPIENTISYNYNVYTDASGIGYGGYVLENEEFE